MADPVKVEELAGKLFDLVKARSGDFVDAHADAKDFLKKRTTRIAEITLDIAAASDPVAKESLKNGLSTVEEAIDSEFLTIANDAARETKDTFKEVLKTVISFVKDVMPVISMLL